MSLGIKPRFVTADEFCAKKDLSSEQVGDKNASFPRIGGGSGRFALNNAFFCQMLLGKTEVFDGKSSRRDETALYSGRVQGARGVRGARGCCAAVEFAPQGEQHRARCEILRCRGGTEARHGICSAGGHAEARCGICVAGLAPRVEPLEIRCAVCAAGGAHRGSLRGLGCRAACGKRVQGVRGHIRMWCEVKMLTIRNRTGRGVLARCVCVGTA